MIRKEKLPRQGQEKDDELTLHDLSNNTKTLSLIHNTICKKGWISESDLFSYFENRKKAIEAVRHLTSGRYHALGSKIQNGQRLYYCTRYTCPNRLQCNRTLEKVKS